MLVDGLGAEVARMQWGNEVTCGRCHISSYPVMVRDSRMKRDYAYGLVLE